MWVKRFADGKEIQEDRKNGITWLKTPTAGLIEVMLSCKGPHGGMVPSRTLHGHIQYWHSRTAVSNNDGSHRDIAERIQGLLPDGTWETITWNGHEYIESIEPRAYGKPVTR